MTPDVDAIQEHGSGLRLDEPLDRAQRARLAGPVRAEQPEDLTTRDPQADAVHGRLWAVGDRQVANIQDDARGRRVRSGHMAVRALPGSRPNNETIEHRVGKR